MLPHSEIERVDVNTMPSERERLVWCEWLTRHGADPSDVCVPGWIERHVDTYRLVCEVYARDDQGHRYLNAEQDDAVREARVIQLEGPPLPFPAFVP